MPTTPCPGCGLILPERLAPPPPEHGASPACFALYGHALAHQSRRFAQPLAGRLLLDAYGAQHPLDGGRMAQDTLAVHLIALHLALARASMFGPDGAPIDALEAQAEAAHAWAASVWGAWADQHGLVARWVRDSGVFGGDDD